MSIQRTLRLPLLHQNNLIKRAQLQKKSKINSIVEKIPINSKRKMSLNYLNTQQAKCQKLSTLKLIRASSNSLNKIINNSIFKQNKISEKNTHDNSQIQSKINWHYHKLSKRDQYVTEKAINLLKNIFQNKQTIKIEQKVPNTLKISQKLLNSQKIMLQPQISTKKTQKATKRKCLMINENIFQTRMRHSEGTKKKKTLHRRTNTNKTSENAEFWNQINQSLIFQCQRHESPSKQIIQLVKYF